MRLQHKSMTLLESLHEPQTTRVESVRVGSGLLLGFSWLTTLLLGALFVKTL